LCGWEKQKRSRRDVMKPTIAMLIALGLAISGAAMAEEKTGDAPGGTGVEQSTESMGATDKQGGAGMPGSGAGAQTEGGMNSTDQGGTGIKGSAEGEGATEKSTEDKTAPMGSKEGMSTGNAPGGTGVEQSTEGEGATKKN
jgi:hypothetical protein